MSRRKRSTKRRTKLIDTCPCCQQQVYLNGDDLTIRWHRKPTPLFGEVGAVCVGSGRYPDNLGVNPYKDRDDRD